MNMNFRQALEFQRRMNLGELPSILTEIGWDIYESDRSNARLRAEYGDTPYAAPDVVPELGHCDGGDAWPQCCTGHRFKEWVFDVVYNGLRRYEERGHEAFATPAWGEPRPEGRFDWESTEPNCGVDIDGLVAKYGA